MPGPASLLRNLQMAIRDDGRSVYEVARVSGLSERALYNAIKDNRWLGGGTIQAVCRTLGITPNFLMGFGERAAPKVKNREKIAQKIVANALRDVVGEEVTVVTVLQWLARNGGRLEDFDKIRDYVDIYGAPQECAVFVNPEHVGRLGLSCLTMGTDTPEAMKGMLVDTDLSLCKKSAGLHKEILEGRQVVDVNTVHEVLPNGRTVSETYTRIVCRVEDKGVPKVLTLAQRFDL